MKRISARLESTGAACYNTLTERQGVSRVNYAISSAVRRNNRPNKPCEDYLVCREGCFVVADGVTQSADEYREGMAVSRAAQAARITAEAVAGALEAAGDPTDAAPEAVRRAVDAVAAFNAGAPEAAFPAAAVFVAGAIRGSELHFLYVGDSMIVLVRGGARIRLSEQQTAHLRVYGSTSGLGITRRALYDTITNNAGHPLGYGVIDGDARALDFLRAAHIRLLPGDRVILSSDGIDKYLAYAPVSELASLAPEALLDRSAAYDQPPYNSYADDKAVIAIDIIG